MSLTEYKNLKIFNRQPIDILTEDINHRHIEIGKFHNQRYWHLFEYPRFRFTYHFDGISNQDRFELLDFFKFHKGKYQPFFIRGFRNDSFQLIEDAQKDSNILKIKPVDFSFSLPAFKHNWLYIEGHDILYHIKVVTKLYTETGGQYEEVVTNQTLLNQVTIEESCKIDIVHCVRFDQDTLTFNSYDINYSETTLTFLELTKDEIEILFNNNFE